MTWPLSLSPTFEPQLWLITASVYDINHPLLSQMLYLDVKVLAAGQQLTSTGMVNQPIMPAIIDGAESYEQEAQIRFHVGNVQLC